MPKIGPTGIHDIPPTRQGDQGGINVGLRLDIPNRMVSLNFGTTVTWFCSPYAQLQATLANIRQRIINEFGDLPFDASTLPLKVQTNPQAGTIEIHLPTPAAVLAANPEVWLALAEKVDEAASRLKSYN